MVFHNILEDLDLDLEYNLPSFQDLYTSMHRKRAAEVVVMESVLPVSWVTCISVATTLMLRDAY